MTRTAETMNAASYFYHAHRASAVDVAVHPLCHCFSSYWNTLIILGHVGMEKNNY